MIQIEGIIGEEYTYGTFAAAISKETDNVIIVDIDSVGGFVDVGFAIYNHLMGLKNSGKRIVTRATNECMSIASIIFMAGDERILGCPLMIHLPWGTVTGNADELKAYTKEVESIGKQITDTYAARTGVPKELISQMMAFETYMSVDEAIDLNFATSRATELQAKQRPVKDAKAIININLKKFKMSKTLKERGLDLLNRFRNVAPIKNLQFETAEGVTLIIEREDGEPQVGDKASPAGVHTLDNGVIIVVEEVDGVSQITEISEGNPSVEELLAMLDEADTLIADFMKENEALQASQKTEEEQKTLDAIKAAGGIANLVRGGFRSSNVPPRKAGIQKDAAEIARSQRAAETRNAAIEAAKSRKGIKK